MKYADENRIPQVVKIWLIAGLVMIFMQVVIGGITRLTGSGLSITRWEIVTGAVPPLNEAKWEGSLNFTNKRRSIRRLIRG